jgi:dihydroorotate dehydrogenase electron transfer subunit
MEDVAGIPSKATRMRYQLEVPILAHEQLAEFEYEITLYSPEVARSAKPGQFMQVLYGQNYNPFTRRPFSVYRTDPEAGTFSIVYLARGAFTQGMREKQVGQNLSVVGPLGNWFQPDPRPEVRHIMVAGGVGAPPLYLLAHAMRCEREKECHIAVVNGARSRSLLVGVKEFGELDIELYYTSEDGSHGLRGVVTHALSNLLEAEDGPAHVYTCGPTGMLRAVADMCVARSIPCQVSVETIMPCGLGVCMGCVVKIKDQASPTGFQYLRSCYEGPVFQAEEIIWE